jgi:P-type E1-E2 ATPase
MRRSTKRAIFVAIAHQPAGIVAVADPIKESIPAAIVHVHQLGIKIIMLTSDNERTAVSRIAAYVPRQSRQHQ